MDAYLKSSTNVDARVSRRASEDDSTGTGYAMYLVSRWDRLVDAHKRGLCWLAPIGYKSGPFGVQFLISTNANAQSIRVREQDGEPKRSRPRGLVQPSLGTFSRLCMTMASGDACAEAIHSSIAEIRWLSMGVEHTNVQQRDGRADAAAHGRPERREDRSIIYSDWHAQGRMYPLRRCTLTWSVADAYDQQPSDRRQPIPRRHGTFR